ncbi:MAG: hypothetical protein QM594_11395 [Niabella sp.]
MFAQTHSTKSLRFRGWSRKSYAAFYSVGRHVTIGNLKSVVADTFLGKQKNSFSFNNEVRLEQDEEYPADPPDELLQLLAALPPGVQHTFSLNTCSPASGEGNNILTRYFNEVSENYLCRNHTGAAVSNLFYLWLMAIIAVSHFYLNHKSKKEI